MDPGCQKWVHAEVQEDVAWSPGSYHHYQSSVSSSYRFFPGVWSSTDICWSLKLPLSLGSILVWNQAFQIMCESRLDSRVKPTSSHCSRILLPSPGSLMGKTLWLDLSLFVWCTKARWPSSQTQFICQFSPTSFEKDKKKGIPLPVTVEM